MTGFLPFCQVEIGAGIFISEKRDRLKILSLKIFKIEIF